VSADTIGAMTHKQTSEQQVLANALLIDIAKIAVMDVKENGDDTGDSEVDLFVWFLSRLREE